MGLSNVAKNIVWYCLIARINVTGIVAKFLKVEEGRRDERGWFDFYFRIAR